MTAQLATIAIKSRGSGNISRLNTRTAKEREVNYYNKNGSFMQRIYDLPSNLERPQI